MKKNFLSPKRIIALLSALTFCTGALAGCGSEAVKETGNTTTTTSATNPAFVDDDEYLVACPKCGSTNVESALDSSESYEEHYICFDCNTEWYVEDGVAYQIADNGGKVEVTTRRVVNPNYGGSGSSGGSQGVNPTRKPSTTKKTTTTTTTKKGTETLQNTADVLKAIARGDFLKYLNWYIDENGNITTDGDKGVFGFAYSTREKCFYATNNSWQRNFGYMELYDKSAQFGLISYDTSRVYFVYGGMEWMIQLWKGQYGAVLIGSEVGVYNRPQGSSASTAFKCVTDAERPIIGLTLYNNGVKQFARAPQRSWWMTGFVPGVLGVAGVAVDSKYTKALSITTSIEFDTEEQRKAFVIGLKQCDHIYNNVDVTKRPITWTEGSGTVPGTYNVSGNKVTLSWQ